MTDLDQIRVEWIEEDWALETDHAIVTARWDVDPLAAVRSGVSPELVSDVALRMAGFLGRLAWALTLDLDMAESHGLDAKGHAIRGLKCCWIAPPTWLMWRTVGGVVSLNACIPHARRHEWKSNVSNWIVSLRRADRELCAQLIDVLDERPRANVVDMSQRQERRQA